MDETQNELSETDIRKVLDSKSERGISKTISNLLAGKTFGRLDVTAEFQKIPDKNISGINSMLRLKKRMDCKVLRTTDGKTYLYYDLRHELPVHIAKPKPKKSTKK